MQPSVSFDSFRFEPASGRLWNGAEEVRLTLKAAAVLGSLIEHAGELVTKQTLLDSVWRGTVVSEDALSSCIQELRKALGDDPKQPRFIETRHRRGYRFIPKASSSAPVPGSTLRDNLAGKPMIVVLPFENTSGDPEKEYFADAITQEIITALSKHRTLLVVARGPSFAFKGHRTDVREVGSQLGANFIVKGSVGIQGRRVRFRVQLIESQTGEYVWADQYDREIEDMLKVQDEITATIASRIEPEIGSAERSRAARKSESELRAWDLYSLGMKHFYRSSPPDNQEAQKYFQRAIELDPTLAQAHAWLSYAQVLEMVYFDAQPDEQRLNHVIATARKAVELDDRDAMTHFTCGRALLARKDYQGAIAELESAVELNPNLAVVYCGLGDSLAYEGRFLEAFPYFEKAIELSPHDPQRWAYYSYRALAHLLAGEFELAIEWAQKAIRVPNSHYWPLAHRVSALGILQRTEDLPAAVAELLQRKPGFTCSYARERLFYVKDPGHLERYIDGLRRAGIPE
jgi:TolB-like protein/Tfp pilus assembly protein PilF